jgi:hypothetical protein
MRKASRQSRAQAEASLAYLLAKLGKLAAFYCHLGVPCFRSSAKVISACS